MLSCQICYIGALVYEALRGALALMLSCQICYALMLSRCRPRGLKTRSSVCGLPYSHALTLCRLGPSVPDILEGSSWHRILVLFACIGAYRVRRRCKSAKCYADDEPVAIFFVKQVAGKLRCVPPEKRAEIRRKVSSSRAAP